MSRFLSHRSLSRARQMMLFRIVLLFISLTFVSFGFLAVLLPAVSSAEARFGKTGGDIVLWCLIYVWLMFTPMGFIEFVRSIERTDDIHPGVRFFLVRRWILLLSSCLVWLAALSFHQVFGFRLPVFSVLNPLDWGVFWMASAILAGYLTHILEYINNEEAREMLDVLSEALTPQYKWSEHQRTDNSSLYQLYRAKSFTGLKENGKVDTQGGELSGAAGETKRDGFLITNIPIFFCFLPSAGGYKIKGIFRPTSRRSYREWESALADVAALWGLDWMGFAEWRRRHEERRYLLDRTFEKCFSLTTWELTKNTITVQGTNRSYMDFLKRDKSADLTVENVRVRDVLEDGIWNREGFDLADAANSHGHFVYCTGVNALYCTKDGFLIFQRRSQGLQTGPGNMGASVAGTLQIKDLSYRARFLCWARLERFAVKFDTKAVLRGLYRETLEELGIEKDEIVFGDYPCTGMALNLLHGRDPNFYFFGRLKLTKDVISRRRWKRSWVTGKSRASDAWEWQHLVFVPIEAVDDEGKLTPQFEDLLRDARHVTGALLAAAKNADFRKERDHPDPPRTRRVYLRNC